MKVFLILMIYIWSIKNVSGQEGWSVQGRVLDANSLEALFRVEIADRKNGGIVRTSRNGHFQLKLTRKKDLLLAFTSPGYQILHLPVNDWGDSREIDLGTILLIAEEENPFYGEVQESITSDQQGEEAEVNTVAGGLGATKDLFLRTASFEFGSSFFKVRNLGSEYSTVYLNGVKMNKMHDGRPDWNNWGGLNDVWRGQETYPGFAISPYGLGNLGGSTNLYSSAWKKNSGLRISYAGSNRSYQQRIMATYGGRFGEGWAYLLSASFRSGQRGYREGTPYRAHSVLLSVDRAFTGRHRLNATLLYAFVERGKTSPMTEEVFGLKNAKYNAYWGYQGNQIRNSRQKRVAEPIIQLNHTWEPNSRTLLQNHICFQFGQVGSSRIDYGGSRWLESSWSIVGGGSNPDPTYYQKLPSYHLRKADDPDYARAFIAQKEFLANGQVDWDKLIEANQSPWYSGNSVYVLYEDRRDDSMLSLKSDVTRRLNGSMKLSLSLSFRKLHSENFANMLDLLGGERFLDVDPYADNWEEAQNDLTHPIRSVQAGEKFKYDYVLSAREWGTSISGMHTTRNVEAHLGVAYSAVSYQREGKYENGAYRENASYGKSATAAFSTISVKSGIMYKWTGRHMTQLSVNFLQQPPPYAHTFYNIRESNALVQGLGKESVLAADVVYRLRLRRLQGQAAAYYIQRGNTADISFYYADGLTGLENAGSSAFVQEILTQADKQSLGAEVSLRAEVAEGWYVKSVAAFGRSVYANDPTLQLSSEELTGPVDYGPAFLKNYYLADGPQQAFSVGLEYSSPNFWWIGLTGNYFRKSFVHVAPITRTRNFLLDTDGKPVTDLDADLARRLLEQEQLDPYVLINLVGGKSWKLSLGYLGFFGAFGNLLNQSHKTGGFEQSRNANYITLKEDHFREMPLFGPKYWFGYGMTFYASVYWRI